MGPGFESQPDHKNPNNQTLALIVRVSSFRDMAAITPLKFRPKRKPGLINDVRITMNAPGITVLFCGKSGG